MASGVVTNPDFESTFMGVRVGPFRRQHEPGWIPRPWMPTVNDCMRGAFCCVTGVSPMNIPWIEPGALSDEGKLVFWARYKQLALILGFEWEERIKLSTPENIKRFDPAEFPFADNEFWIAGVGKTGDGRGRGTSHAIVMRGRRLHYDIVGDPRSNCQHEARKRRPTRVGWGIALKPVCPAP